MKKEYKDILSKTTKKHSLLKAITGWTDEDQS